MGLGQTAVNQRVTTGLNHQGDFRHTLNHSNMKLTEYWVYENYPNNKARAHARACSFFKVPVAMHPAQESGTDPFVTRQRRVALAKPRADRFASASGARIPRRPPI